MTVTELLALHRLCTGNRRGLAAGGKAGCFHCLSVYPADTVGTWIDHDSTALCPVCGIDSVLPGVTDRAVLTAMQAHWFGSMHAVADAPAAE